MVSGNVTGEDERLERPDMVICASYCVAFKAGYVRTVDEGCSFCILNSDGAVLYEIVPEEVLKSGLGWSSKLFM